ncbi:hypothetical protein ACIRG5_19040 [Lentzea sp. NPDC102401]|uniref:hypothetical protein n=1 Tax=Lentzea sp. NPDC102401 TaxID=3364128 RepID=UPI00381105EB
MALATHTPQKAEKTAWTWSAVTKVATDVGNQNKDADDSEKKGDEGARAAERREPIAAGTAAAELEGQPLPLQGTESP